MFVCFSEGFKDHVENIRNIKGLLKKKSFRNMDTEIREKKSFLDYYVFRSG